MSQDDTKTIRLGWIALVVVVDASGQATSAHTELHAEKGLTPRGALTFAQVAEVAEADLIERALPADESRITATGAAPREGHAAVCAMDGDASACPCQRPISESQNRDSEPGAH